MSLQIRSPRERVATWWILVVDDRAVSSEGIFSNVLSTKSLSAKTDFFHRVCGLQGFKVLEGIWYVMAFAEQCICFSFKGTPQLILVLLCGGFLWKNSLSLEISTCGLKRKTCYFCLYYVQSHCLKMVLDLIPSRVSVQAQLPEQAFLCGFHVLLALAWVSQHKQNNIKTCKNRFLSSPVTPSCHWHGWPLLLAACGRTPEGWGNRGERLCSVDASVCVCVSSGVGAPRRHDFFLFYVQQKFEVQVYNSPPWTEVV